MREREKEREKTTPYSKFSSGLCGIGDKFGFLLFIFVFEHIHFHGAALVLMISLLDSQTRNDDIAFAFLLISLKFL